MVLAALVLLLAGCSGDDAPTTDGTGPTGDTGAPAAAPTFTRVNADLFRTSCALSGCHASAASGNGLALVEGEEYASLVDAPSLFAPGEVLVIPGDPDGSYVVKKITGAEGIEGDPMPPPFGTLDPRLLAELRAWIEAGALDN